MTGRATFTSPGPTRTTARPASRRRDVRSLRRRRQPGDLRVEQVAVVDPDVVEEPVEVLLGAPVVLVGADQDRRAVEIDAELRRGPDLHTVDPQRLALAVPDDRDVVPDTGART